MGIWNHADDGMRTNGRADGDYSLLSFSFAYLYDSSFVCRVPLRVNTHKRYIYIVCSCVVNRIWTNEIEYRIFDMEHSLNSDVVFSTSCIVTVPTEQHRFLTKFISRNSIYNCFGCQTTYEHNSRKWCEYSLTLRWAYFDGKRKVSENQYKESPSKQITDDNAVGLNRTDWICGMPHGETKNKYQTNRMSKFTILSYCLIHVCVTRTICRLTQIDVWLSTSSSSYT